MTDALLGGTSSMRDAGKTYLPQWPAEEDGFYKARLSSAVLFPAFARTVDVLSGKPFSRPLTFSAPLNDEMTGWADDIDLQGRDLHAFAADLCRTALSHGLAGILVDYPPASNLRTRADEIAAGVRPYFVEVRPQDILGWKTARMHGATILVQLRLLETVSDDSDPWADTPVEQVRVLYPNHWEVWRENKNASDDARWELIDRGTNSLGKIPFIPVYGLRRSFLAGTSPLVELAHMNVEHWQSRSDQQTIMHVARVPVLFGRGFSTDAPLTIGAAQAVLASSPDADLKYVEHSGAAIDGGRMDILDLEDRMRQVGAELLVIKPGNTTVAQTISDSEPGTCALQRIVQDEEHALDAALALAAEWVGASIAPQCRVSIYQDFGVTSVAEASADLLRAMNLDGTLSDETLFREIQRRGWIQPQLDWDDEKSRISQNAIKANAKLQD
jgi:hypothetical protein